MFKKYLVSTLFTVAFFQATQMVANADEIFADESIIVGYPLEETAINDGYLLPATPSPCNGWDLYARGDFLYWSIYADEIAGIAQKVTLNNPVQDVINYFQATPYKPGFRVSLGANLRSVVLDATYTRVRTNSTIHVNARNGEAIRLTYVAPSAPITPNVAFSTLKSTHEMGMDWGLLSLQTPVYFGKKIILNLTYGLSFIRSLSKHHIVGTALNVVPPPQFVTSDGFANSIQKDWALGPDLGCKAYALLPWGFKGIATVNLALQYGTLYYSKSTTSFPNAIDPGLAIPPDTGNPLISDNTTIKPRSHTGHMQVNHGAELGLGWGGYFGCDRYHVDLYATYSVYYQHIFCLATIFSPFGSDLLSLRQYNIHGIVIGGRLDF